MDTATDTVQLLRARETVCQKALEHVTAANECLRILSICKTPLIFHNRCKALIVQSLTSLWVIFYAAFVQVVTNRVWLYIKALELNNTEVPFAICKVLGSLLRCQQLQTSTDGTCYQFLRQLLICTIKFACSRGRKCLRITLLSSIIFFMKK